MINTKDKFKECLDILSSKVIDKNGTPNSCKIHDAFKGLNNKQHNCLGCNFADTTDLIIQYLNSNLEYTDIQKNFTIYILLLYLLVERFEIILGIIQLPETYKDKHFKVFQQIRKWANFIKHPKSFILTHHPTYDFENSGINHNVEFAVTINEQFVTEFYKGQANQDAQKKTNNELYNKLSNKKDVLVLYPDIAKLTNKICYSYNKFIELIINNAVYKEILNDETTFRNYFENQ